jgi:hypothetical protein
MTDLMIEIETAKTATELRPALDAALAKVFPGGMMQRRWEDGVLHLSGPGAKGTVQLEAGRLVGRAVLGPPATMMRKLIEDKIGAALRLAAG